MKTRNFNVQHQLTLEDMAQCLTIMVQNHEDSAMDYSVQTAIAQMSKDRVLENVEIILAELGNTFRDQYVLGPTYDAVYEYIKRLFQELR